MTAETFTYGAGEHSTQPFVVERGSQSARFVLTAGARLHLTAFVLSTSETSQLSLTVDLAGEGAEFEMHSLFIASGVGETAGRADIDVKVNHLVPDCVSRQLIKGIAAGEATGSFSGLVHVAPDAQHTDAVQRNQNLQLTDSAHIFTRPQLEIYADDVKCSHGATVGRLDEEAIYYMRQRGISESEARRMQMQGFAEEIINRCPSENLREQLSSRIDGIIEGL
jgi:Fe-S cluster assembly protein SufD